MEVDRGEGSAEVEAVVVGDPEAAVEVNRAAPVMRKKGKRWQRLWISAVEVDGAGRRGQRRWRSTGPAGLQIDGASGGGSPRDAEDEE